MYMCIRKVAVGSETSESIRMYVQYYVEHPSPEVHRRSLERRNLHSLESMLCNAWNNKLIGVTTCPGRQPAGLLGNGGFGVARHLRLEPDSPAFLPFFHCQSNILYTYAVAAGKLHPSTSTLGWNFGNT